jgi:hypothetical protein
LTVDLAAAFDGNRRVTEERMATAREALEELVRFRKAHQHKYFSDLLWVTNFWERPRWDVDALASPTEFRQHTHAHQATETGVPWLDVLVR